MILEFIKIEDMFEPDKVITNPERVDTKTKKFTPKSKAVVEIWANAAQFAIAEMLNDGFLSTFNKKNMRSLTSKEQAQSEQLKFQVLCGLEPLGAVSEEIVYNILFAQPTDEYKYAVSICNSWTKDISKQIGRKLTLDELHKIQSNIYVYINGENYG